MSTATVSAGMGLLLVVASHHAQAAFAGVVVPGRLWFSPFPPQRDRLSAGRNLPASVLALLFSRLYERMGDDMQAWTDVRLRAASPEPKWIAGAVTYYAHQVRGRIKDEAAQTELERRERSIICSIEIVRLINLDTTRARLEERLQAHPSLRVRSYPDQDLQALAQRLRSDALGELHQFLDRIYQLGQHKQLIYPMRPSAYRYPARQAEPTAPDL
ncbi:MAG TPA: hypothetical protein VMG38_00595 [Trebonia sp.]|nr:hypothetical protein [Trebonia sp.]